MRFQVLMKSRRFAGGADAGEPHPSDAGVRQRKGNKLDPKAVAAGRRK